MSAIDVAPTTLVRPPESTSVYLNGEVMPTFEAGVEVNDRGFLFGDGAYEVIRAPGGQPYQWREHMERLRATLKGLEITGADADGDVLHEVAVRLLRENGHDTGDATIYVQVTRGAAPRTHWYPDPPVTPTVFVSTATFRVPTETRTRGATAILVPDQRWARCDLKTLNLLPNGMAKQRAHEVGAFEAIFHRGGFVTEGANTSVFAVFEGVIHTHPLTPAVLPGITRATVLRFARQLTLPVRERPIAVARLMEASEVFLSGTTTDVQPIVALDGEPVGLGVPGPMATALRQRLSAEMGLDTDASSRAQTPPPVHSP